MKKSLLLFVITVFISVSLLTCDGGGEVVDLVEAAEITQAEMAEVVVAAVIPRILINTCLSTKPLFTRKMAMSNIYVFMAGQQIRL